MGEHFGFMHDGVVAAHLEYAPLMERECAEGALTKAAAVRANGKLDFRERRYATCGVIVGVPGTRVGEFGHGIELFGGKGGTRRILHHVDAVGIGLYQALACNGIHVLLLDIKTARVRQTIRCEFVPAGEQLVVVYHIERIGARGAVYRAIYVGNVAHGKPAC